MKTKSKVLRTKNRIFFLITVIVFTGFENARAQRADSSIFINVTSFDDHVMHIVWDRIADGNIFTLEKSTDGISFYTLSVVNEDSVENITEIFTQVTKKYNKIFYSTEGDNKRFIYNDDDAHQRGLVYRVKIIKNDFSIVFTRNEHEYKEQQSRAAFQSAVNNLRIPIPCPPVGVPPIGSTATGNYQTTTVNCCAVTLQEYVFLACASIGINCAPGNGDCIAACNCTWDPCCVHTCAYYFSCSCPPWPSCGFNSPQLPQWIVVSVAPAVTLTISSNSPTTVCAGNSIVILSANANGAPPFTYNWSNAATTSSIQVSTSSPGNFIYTVTITDANGCTNSATRTIIVNPLPVVMVSPNASICFGQNTVLSSSGANSYFWSPSTGLSTITGNSVTANPVSTTTYTVVGNVNGCTASAQVTVTVNPLPVVTVSPSPAICNGQTTTLTASGANTFIWSPSATLSSSTGTSVSANPVSTTTYTVTGNWSGCTATAQVTVTVNLLPVVTVSPSPTICNGQTTTLTANGANTFIWSPSATLSSSTGASVSANPVSTTTYIVTGNLNGCTATAQVTVTVNPLPVVTVSPSPTICFGQTITLNAGGANTYIWSPSLSLSSSTGASVSANPLSTTTYIVTGDLNGCTATAQVTVTVNPLPVVTVSPPPTICNGQTTTLTASGANTYSWSPSATLSSSTGASVSANPLSTTTYTVTGDLNGCTASAQVTVTVTPLPIITVSPSPTICIGYTIALAAGGANTYTWSPSATLSSSTGASVSASPLATTTYTVTGDLNGCTATAQVTVTVVQLPAVTASLASTICIGQSITLIASGANTYMWSPSATLSSSTGASVSANPLFTTTYTVTGDLNGCTATAQVTVTINPLPVVTVSLSPTICSGQAITLAAGGANTYAWSPFTSLSSSTGASVSASPLSTTTYTVTGNLNGCTASAQVTVTVNQPPVVSFLPNPVSGCEPLTVYFTDGSFAPAGSAFNWNFGDNSSSNLQNPVHTYSTSGNFTVTLTITNPQNCSAFLSAPAVKVFPSAIANFDLSPRVAALGYGKIFFSDLSINPTSWNWDFGDGAGHSMLQNPFYVYQDTGTYKVRLAILSSHNCPDTAYETVIVKADEFSVYIPNAFTPDDNGRNETFNAVVLNGSKYQMAIFDRWGSQIYQTDKFDLPWNGHVYGSREMCPIGVYIYLITVWDFGNRPHEFAGHVTLLK